ncbi:MAG: BlaI/MecI/CopY family transcriptional regulator [Planctomycetota bacterium]
MSKPVPGHRAPPPPRLTSGELELMDLLWQHGPLSLSEAHRRFGQQFPDRSTGYTTIQTRLNRLVEKGHAERSDSRPALYSAAVPRKQIRAGHLDELVQRLSGGNVVPLVAHLVEDRRINADQLAELKQLVMDAEQELKSAQQSSQDASSQDTGFQHPGGGESGGAK